LPARVGKARHVLQKKADFALNEVRLFAHGRIAHQTLHQMNRQHKQRGRDDENARPQMDGKRLQVLSRAQGSCGLRDRRAGDSAGILDSRFHGNAAARQRDS
jgi:hypothetical protein